MILKDKALLLWNKSFSDELPMVFGIGGLALHKSLIIVSIAIITGFFSGYFSSPVTNYISSLEMPDFSFSKISWSLGKQKGNAGNGSSHNDAVGPDSVKGSISAEAAVNAVKSLPSVKQLVDSAAARGCQVSFRADQPPTKEYPVWLVELREIYPNQIPDIIFLKVDALSGQVLDLQKEELQAAGYTLSSSLPTNLDGVKPLQSKSIYNENLKSKVRLDRYKGLEVESDRNRQVIRITVTGQDYTGPRDLKIGNTGSEVLKKLGKANIAQEELLIYNSLDHKNLQLHIKMENEEVISFSLIQISE